MNDLPMPSDLRKDAQTQTSEQTLSEPIEPPSVKLIVRLFVVPLIIVACAVGVMFLIGLMAGSEPTMQEALARLKAPGGERTADYLVGPASKQRYLDAKALVDLMKQGMTEPQRLYLASQLVDILNNHTQPNEGDVQNLLLLALGRVWERTPADPAFNSPDAMQSKQQVLDTLLKYADSDQLATRKAAVLATVFLAGQNEAAGAIPKLLEKLGNSQEDVDVRIAAATALGPLANPSDTAVINALHSAMRDTDPRDAEVVWSSALSLAELNQPDVADTILKLLSRNELSHMEYYDRETDPKNPTFRKLSDEEQQRFLINTMLGARKLDVPAVQEKLKQITQSDPSPRVRAAGVEMLGNERVKG